ncbi:phosphomevalonate kinase [Candidatus Woesearchaeota archaeon]|jgi:phosphomevalonate kinase|nr:phosphomevalonate kinase [Candidatus Woesearchaeota archaeon]MBT5272619.1 phosphomevalonate kinase [Candidatus Woesearchaeota archaeon]MBT6041744.1 phosphomevalonate kinase [Candidatus Woesearchaeota archaeon]MBT6337171.1 phosphomevalonate kinase [Candidatus Woesearchaeota archaeon]MBT7927809.1 phosphomevalonate kinase [Candidatus Woesearchaeota archaeon]
MITIKAPGKLMLAGEWAVLETGKPSIVAAVDKYVECSIEETNSSSIQIPGMEKIEFVFEKDKLRFRKILTSGEKEKLLFAKNTIEVFLTFMEENANPIESFNIKTKNHNTTITIPNGSDSEGTEKKIGFGSSAATCVAIGTAIMKSYDYDVTEEKHKEIIFKLASIAHFTAQEFRGSCFDVAASTYGGVIIYKAFNGLWLKNEIKRKVSLTEILNGDWPHLKIKPITLPENLKILCCYTSTSADTRKMIAKMEKFRENNYDEYMELIDEFEEAVNSIIDALGFGNPNEIKMMWHKNQSCLKELDEKSKIGILTPELKKLIEIANKHDCVGKISGAGGGDSGIAICFNEENCKKIKKEWKESKLYLIDIKISENKIINEKEE